VAVVVAADTVAAEVFMVAASAVVGFTVAALADVGSADRASLA
jgi:hypothetical protein